MNRCIVYFVFQRREDLNIFPKLLQSFMDYGQVANKSVGKFSEPCRIYETI